MRDQHPASPSMGPFPKETKERVCGSAGFPSVQMFTGGFHRQMRGIGITDRPGKGGQSGPGVRLLQIEEKEGSERQKT